MLLDDRHLSIKYLEFVIRMLIATALEIMTKHTL
jgi:hypothetical protein